MKLLKKRKGMLTKSMAALADPGEFSAKDTIEIKAEFPDCRNFQIGPCAYYVLDFQNNRFLYMDKRIENITGIPADEYLSKKPAETIGEAAYPSHLESIAEYISKAVEILSQSKPGEEMTACIEHNICTHDGKHKRIISQFYPEVFDKLGRPIVNKGRVIDITHIRNEGLPRMFVICNNKIIYEETASPETVIKGGELNLTKTEIQLMKLLSEGKSSKDISEIMNISMLTVYTHRRNIRQNTGMELNKVISVLKDKGILK